MTDTDLILHILSKNQPLSSSEIFEMLNYQKSSRTLIRLLDKLVDKKLVSRVGKNKGTKYKINSSKHFKIGNGNVHLHFDQLNGDAIVKKI